MVLNMQFNLAYEHHFVITIFYFYVIIEMGLMFNIFYFHQK